ncbi:hypothetical protein COK15_25810 [Bacillus cereus]|nr:hypothetical protein CN494_22665 [Bacillus cereus]PFC37658.1 hypothetical protein CN310_13735 [Bacillus cereus]PFQ72947.1 hypothetical protein COK15_25810 [Bacillus cereus]
MKTIKGKLFLSIDIIGCILCIIMLIISLVNFRTWVHPFFIFIRQYINIYKLTICYYIYGFIYIRRNEQLCLKDYQYYLLVPYYYSV